jgi:hypothetical protein
MAILRAWAGDGPCDMAQLCIGRRGRGDIIGFAPAMKCGE